VPVQVSLLRGRDLVWPARCCSGSDLARIADGSVTLAFRRWDRLREGGRRCTRRRAGDRHLEPVTVADLSDETARRARYSSLASWCATSRYDGGQLTGSRSGWPATIRR
jgi:hypothetical protein